ncbi:malonate--CoA ligase ACSF3, mitochondrial-like [Anneissia japonica]|uniref:malonate--CoA ligase ACSF3, mitochondrial-like n=1 Tax=Anneissia japonica TaxID=1529436 RepID=UPI001425A289|nr:malonate--CoA ligase ACSF3, mitochondrial-like [Anneissia japonica]XP_033119612.1 malonate--CoA ligase ACSF3, mitochondrial-like [Anneissia japonica]XP_033119613.1 malonate--CoA ligase ACSF3, mitochondrial-like [Anneissia japonica]XP_033119614.1 malonate--CoA ligase ACSF3, mitochondrial-like [Anneissia japonica]
MKVLYLMQRTNQRILQNLSRLVVSGRGGDFNAVCLRICMCRCYTSDATRPVFVQTLRENYGGKVAIVDSIGEHTYNKILSISTKLSQGILSITERDSTVKSSTFLLNGERVAFLCPNNVTYVVAQWATWMSGATAVPLCKSHPPSELEYFLNDSGASLVVTTPENAEKVEATVKLLGIKHIILNQDKLASSDDEASPITDFASLTEGQFDLDSFVEKRLITEKWRQIKWKNRSAQLVYTSGTTGRPKGVLSTFGNVQSQVTMLLDSWGWSNKDVVLHVLPLHHIHGIVNLLVCPLWCGATCVMLPEFDAEKVWSYLLDETTPRVNVFMAVPTIYAKLLQAYNTKYGSVAGGKTTEFIKATLRTKMRLMVSGSAALPQPIMEQWEKITGHRLLERYGMTEFGMALSNPLKGLRTPGSVGTPLPSVQVRVVTSDGQITAEGNSVRTSVTSGMEGVSGELQVKGPNVFKLYWQKPEATEEAFTEDGWFKTGDTVVYEDSVYRILGRTSVDIIKSGGYKISSLDVERRLLAHHSISECAVVGLPDMTWGQRVAAVVSLKDDRQLTLKVLRDWCQDKMPSYVIPTELRILPSLPRNAMGKINKKELAEAIFGDDYQIK